MSNVPVMLQGDLPTLTMTAERPFLQIGLKLEILPSLRTIQRSHGTARIYGMPYASRQLWDFPTNPLAVTMFLLIGFRNTDSDIALV